MLQTIVTTAGTYRLGRPQADWRHARLGRSGPTAPARSPLLRSTRVPTSVVLTPKVVLCAKHQRIVGCLPERTAASKGLGFAARHCSMAPSTVVGAASASVTRSLLRVAQICHPLSTVNTRRSTTPGSCDTPTTFLARSPDSPSVQGREQCLRVRGRCVGHLCRGCRPCAVLQWAVRTRWIQFPELGLPPLGIA